MITSLESLSLDGRLKTSICIIGAGALGITMAAKLAGSREADVLVLEAGGREGLPDPAPSKVKNTGDIESFRAGSYNEGLGGSTLSWGGQILPFTPADFIHRQKVANSGWPITFGDLADYYNEVESLLRVDYEPSNGSIFPEELTHPSIASGLDLTFSKWCPEKNFAKHFSKIVCDNEYIKFVLNSEVIRIIPASEPGGCQKVIVHGQDGSEYIVDATVVILAAGGLENYSVLSRSLQLASKLPALGRYYHDHIGFYGAKITPINIKKFNALFATKLIRGGKCVPKIVLSDSFLTRENCLNVYGSIEVEATRTGALELFRDLSRNLNGAKPIRSVSANLLGLTKVFPEVFRTFHSIVFKKHIPFPSHANYFLLASSEVSPLSQSRLSLGNSKEAREPIVSAAWFVKDDVRDSLRDYYIRAKAFLESNEIASVDIKQCLFSDSREWVKHAYSLYHHMGATRMGNNIDSSVVDKNCKVHGANNIFVAGCSVLTTGSSSNPTFTALALGLRLVDHIDSNGLVSNTRCAEGVQT